jgi:autotransporter-associated beta strand protein
MNIRNAPFRLILLGCVLLTATTRAGSTFTWSGAANDNMLQNSNNWTPVTAGRPAANQNDTMLWNGSVAGNLALTNGTGGVGAGNFDGNPGIFVNLTAAQTGNVTIVESNGFTGRIRLAITNGVNVANGAGALTFGNGGTVAFPIAFAANSSGNGAVTASWTNNSTSPVTFNSDVFYVMGGGNNHTWVIAGTGNWVLNSKFQAQNNGSSLSPVIVGPGTITLGGASAPGIAYSGNYGNLTLGGGTLQLAAANALGTGNTLIITNGNLDSSVASLVNSGNNPQSWNGNFGFVGTQSLDLGLGPVTMNGNRIVTVNASTLSISGGISGTNFSLTKAGAGTLALNGGNTYVGGTVISNGTLRLGSASAIPSGTAVAESLTNNGTLDLNGNSITLSAFNGTGFVDTISGGSPTLTVGDFDANGTFTGTIQNSAGSLAFMKTGAGTLTLSGANTYSGGTTVSSGTLAITNTSGSGTGSGAVMVNSGAAFGGSGAVAGAVTWQAGSSGFFVSTNLGGLPFAIGGSVTLNNNTVTVNVPGVIPLAPGTYTLVTYNNTGSSGAFASTGVIYTGAGVSPGTASSISTSGGLVTLTVTSLVNGTHATWTNNANGNWSVAANWDSNPIVPHAAGDLATLGLGAAYTTVTLDANESVGGVVFTNVNSFDVADAGNTLTFDNSGAGAILSVAAGSSNLVATAVALNDNLSVSLFPATALSIANVVSSTSPAETLALGGGGTLTLAGNNTYGPAAGTVGTTLSQGITAQLSNNNGLSAGDVLVTNGAETVRALTALTVANNFNIASGSLGLDNNGNNATLSGNLSGNGSFGKNGLGTLTLSGNNTYTNTTSLSAGTIKLGSATGIPGGPGNANLNMGSNTVLDLNGLSPVLNGINSSFTSATIDSLTGGAVTLTVGESGAFATYQGAIQNSSGSLALVKDGAGTQTVAGTNTFTGGTTVNGGVLQVGNGTTNSSGVGIAVTVGLGPVVVNTGAALQFNLWGTNTFTNAISGAGGLNLNNINLTLMLVTSNSFSGPVAVNAGSLWIKNANGMGAGTGGPGSKNITVANGTVGNSQIHLDGSQTNLTLDSSLALFLSNQGGCLFNEAGTNTILGPIFMPFGGGSPLIVVKSGFLNFAGPTVSSDGNANARVLTLSGVGGLVNSAFVDTNNLTASAQVNSGVWTFTGASTTLGTLTAAGGSTIFNGSWSGGLININSGGTLTGNAAASNLTVNAGGNFVPGAFGTIGGFTVSNLLTISGAVYASLNKSLVPSNTLITVATTGATNIVATGGSSLIVSNLGPALAAGDRFQIFNQGVTNGLGMTLVLPALSGGLVWTNNLAVDGSISVTIPAVVAPTNSPTISGISLSGGNVVISATNGDTGATYYLLDSTNVTTPVAQWKTIATNVANGSSFSFTATNGVTAGAPQQFYILSSTNYNP